MKGVTIGEIGITSGIGKDDKENENRHKVCSYMSKFPICMKVSLHESCMQMRENTVISCLIVRLRIIVMVLQATYWMFKRIITECTPRRAIYVTVPPRWQNN